MWQVERWMTVAVAAMAALTFIYQKTQRGNETNDWLNAVSYEWKSAWLVFSHRIKISRYLDITKGGSFSPGNVFEIAINFIFSTQKHSRFKIDADGARMQQANDVFHTRRLCKYCFIDYFFEHLSINHSCGYLLASPKFYAFENVLCLLLAFWKIIIPIEYRVGKTESLI